MSFKLVRVCLLFFFCLETACIPVGYNRYQTAHTLGAGEMKLVAGFATTSTASIRPEEKMEDEMDERMEKWWKEQYNDSWSLSLLKLTDEFGGLTNTVYMIDAEIIFALGFHDRVDVEVRYSAFGYLRENVKIELLQLGKRGMMSIAPGFGYKNVYSSSCASTEVGLRAAMEVHVCDRYKGYLVTGELPLLFGWKFETASPYIVLNYVEHYLDFNLKRRIVGLEPGFNQTIYMQTWVHNPGIFVGSEFRFDGFVIYPEIGIGCHLYEKDVSSQPFFWIYPGLALGAIW